MTVRRYRVKGGTNDVSLNVYPKMRKKVVFSPPRFSFGYKNVVLFVLGAVLPCLPACISHKHPMLINSHFVYHFASRWILSASRQTNLSFSRSWHQVSGLNQKIGGSSPLLCQGLWVQVPIWVAAGSESHPRSEVSGGVALTSHSKGCGYKEGGRIEPFLLLIKESMEKVL